MLLLYTLVIQKKKMAFLTKTPRKQGWTGSPETISLPPAACLACSPKPVSLEAAQSRGKPFPFLAVPPLCARINSYVKSLLQFYSIRFS